MNMVKKLKMAFMKYPQPGHGVEDMPESDFPCARKKGRGDTYVQQYKLLSAQERAMLKEEGEIFRNTHKKLEEHVS